MGSAGQELHLRADQDQAAVREDHEVRFRDQEQQEPTDEQLSECDIPEGESMYAYYEGVALIERGMDGEPILPDRIVIFQRSFEEDFDTPEQLRRELAVTIAHEIAHHFGTDDDRLEDLGKY